MAFANFTTGQLEFLSSHKFRPDKLIKAAHQPSTAAMEQGFETVAACQAEDRQRAAALRALVPQRPGKRGRNRKSQVAGLPGDPLELAATLDSIAALSPGKPIPACMASAVYTRYRRIGLLGAILQLVAEHRELGTAWLSYTSASFRFDQHHRWSEVARIARADLEQQLHAAGALTAPGFVVAFGHAVYVPNLRQFELRYRGIIAGRKLLCVQQPRTRRINRISEPDSKIQLHKITNLAQRSTAILPNFLSEIGPCSPGGGLSISRMREPAYSLCLLWLAQRQLSELTAISGAFYWDGRLALAECHPRTVNRAAPHFTADVASQLIHSSSPSPHQTLGAEIRRTVPGL